MERFCALREVIGSPTTSSYELHRVGFHAFLRPNIIIRKLKRLSPSSSFQDRGGWCPTFSSDFEGLRRRIFCRTYAADPANRSLKFFFVRRVGPGLSFPSLCDHRLDIAASPCPRRGAREIFYPASMSAHSPVPSSCARDPKPFRKKRSQILRPCFPATSRMLHPC